MGIFIQERDKLLLILLKRYEIMSTKQIQKLVFPKIQYTTMMRRLRLLEKNKIIKQGAILDNYTRTWTLDSRVYQHLGELKIYEFTNRNTINHDITLTDLRLRLESFNLASNWTTSLSIRAEVFRAIQRKSANLTLIPDGLMIEPIQGKSNAIAIELELTQKSESRYVEILNDYRRNSGIKCVWYIIKNKAIIEALERALARAYLKPEYLWYSYLDQILSNDEIHIANLKDKVWLTPKELGFDSYLSQTSAHELGSGVSSEKEVKQNPFDEVKLLES